MDNLVFLFIIPLLSIILWCTDRILRRMNKRKIYGKRLLVVKDVTSNMDLFFGIIFLIPAVRLIMILLQEDFDFSMLIFMWPVYFPIISIVNFVKAFSKVEIYEKGVLSKDGLWDWNSAESYSLKEGKNTATFEFKLNKRIFKSDKITVLKSDIEKVENAINEAVQGV